jgi:hypothetical protein
MQDAAHADQLQFQEEPLQEPMPPVGEIVYARPFAMFKNHYPVWVDGQQKWYAECAAESCAMSPMFPGRLVIVRSVCRETKAPVELVARDGILLDYSPRTLRVHLGHPLRDIPKDLLGWCEYNSFFASEDGARQWGSSHPGVHGITRAPEQLAQFIGEIVGKGRLEYTYQPTVPVSKVVLNLIRYGLTRPTILGLPMLDPFWLPTPRMFIEWIQNGWGYFVRLALH